VKRLKSPAPLRFYLEETGFTALELVAVITVIAILALLVFPVVTTVRRQPEAIRCMQHMRTLHAALSTYITDRGHWPQQPPELTSEDAVAGWWLAEMKDFGAPPEIWHCPTLTRELAEGKRTEAETPSLHFVPGRFDSNRFSPYRWSTQPWLASLCDHGEGSLIMFPDGHIETFKEIYEHLAEN
jgi:prepilin-type N-terminal cleavage/methylation domain-containing protein